MKLILSNPQAKAIADAMMALNNVSMKLKAEIGDIDGDYINCFEKDGIVKVNRVYHFQMMEQECYDSQSAFLLAYGLN